MKLADKVAGATSFDRYWRKEGYRFVTAECRI